MTLYPSPRWMGMTWPQYQRAMSDIPSDRPRIPRFRLFRWLPR